MKPVGCTDYVWVCSVYVIVLSDFRLCLYDLI